MKPLNDEFARLPEFDWDKAKNFYYVAKKGSQTEAAKFLNVSQSSLSRQVNLLETELNCTLVQSGPKGVTLTRKGEELFQIIERAFIDLRGFSYNHAAMCNKGTKRKIRILTTHPIAAYILSPHLLYLNDLYPNVLFEVLANDEKIDVMSSDVDMAITLFDTDSNGIEQEYAFSLEKRLFTSQKYIDKYGEPRSIEELKHHHFVTQTTPEKLPYSDIHWILKLGVPKGERHTPVFTSNSLECLVEAVAEGRGIMSCYEEMQIIRRAGFKNVLPHVTAKPVKFYCTYPSFLKEDSLFSEIKDALLKRLSPEKR